MNKTCKLCSKERYGSSSWCRKHYFEREKQKKLDKIEKKKTTKKFQESIRKKLHRIAWKLVSEWVRKDAMIYKDDGIAECYTCGNRFHWKDLHCGHRHHGKLDFDLRNLKAQCVKCNTYLHGNLGNYERRLIEQYGIEWSKKLELDANTDLGYTIEEIKKVIKEFTI